MSDGVIRLQDNPGFFDLVGNMRAMRRLKPDPVPEALLRKVLDAGVKAPSGQNKQPWSFLVIQDAAGREWFAERYKAAIESRFGAVRVPERDSSLTRELKALRYQIDHMHEVPVLLVVCGLRDLGRSGCPPRSASAWRHPTTAPSTLPFRTFCWPAEPSAWVQP